MASQLHFLLIPLMSSSHIIPLTDLAKSLARRGVLVSMVTTPLNAQRYKPTLDANPNIRMLPLPFPCREAGLPPGCENLDTLTTLDHIRDFFHACKLLKSPLHALIQTLHPAPNCIISTSALSWTQDIAHALRIPRYVFETFSCFTLHCYNLITELDPQSETFLVPRIPHKIEFSKNQLLRLPSKDSECYVDLDPPLGRGTLVNSFQELEPWYLEALREERGKNVWTVGPVSLANRSRVDSDHYCLTWLDSMERNSVVYACFGSLCSLSLQQIIEIGLGLEESSLPFVWVIRKQEKNIDEVEKWLAAEGFEERVKGRGLIIRGWAPQVMILSHPAVGGFLTHCGWNSILEGVSAGVPVLTWPMHTEQFYNEKMVVDVLGIGVRVGVESFMDKQDLVGRERVRLAVRELMEVREGRRERAEALARAAKEAFEEEGGSSFMNVTLFIEDVVRANAEMVNA